MSIKFYAKIIAKLIFKFGQDGLTMDETITISHLTVDWMSKYGVDGVESFDPNALYRNLMEFLIAVEIDDDGVVTASEARTSMKEIYYFLKGELDSKGDDSPVKDEKRTK